tara:strand:+ start:2069 stop:2581 length:513 start_codon:yes stop_codon:yes gene_type:complete
MNLEIIKDSYLEHIKICIKSDAWGRGLLRTFIDNWFAYYKQGPFLNSNSNPNWYNKPSPVKDKDALLEMHFISDMAFDVIEQGSDVRLIKEHSIPVHVIRKILIQEKPKTINDIENILLRFYRLGVLTKDEDDILNLKGLNSKMPTSWDFNESVFSRYEVAGIKGKLFNQ